LWAVKDGQYEDDYSPSVRILFDDEANSLAKKNELTHSKSTSKTSNSNSFIDK